MGSHLEKSLLLKSRTLPALISLGDFHFTKTLMLFWFSRLTGIYVVLPSALALIAVCNNTKGSTGLRSLVDLAVSALQSLFL